MVPDDLYLLVFLSDAYRYKGRFDLALGVYEKALKYYPNDPIVSFYLGGWLYYSKNEYDKAIQLFSKSIKQGMPEFRILVYIGSAYRHMGDLEKAKVFYDSSVYACQKILEKEPDNPWALSELGLSYAFIGKEKEAIEKGEQAMKTEMSPNQVYNLALIYAILKKYNLAVKTLEEVWELDPSYVLVALSDPNFENLKYSRKFERLQKREW